MTDIAISFNSLQNIMDIMILHSLKSCVPLLKFFFSSFFFAFLNCFQCLQLKGLNEKYKFAFIKLPKLNSESGKYTEFKKILFLGV